MLEHTFPSSCTQSAPPPLRLPNHSLPHPPQNQREGHKPCPRGQRPGVRRPQQGVVPQDFSQRGGVGRGVGGGDGVGRDMRYPAEVEERRRGWGSIARGRKERRGVENEGPIPDASLWLPQPPPGQNQSAGTGDLKEDSALAPFPALPSKANELAALPSKAKELPALPFISHCYGQRPTSFKLTRRSLTKVPPHSSPPSHFSSCWLYWVAGHLTPEVK